MPFVWQDPRPVPHSSRHVTGPIVPNLADWPRADALLDRALALPPDERDTLIAHEAAGEPELLAALRAVLREAALPDDFLGPGGALRGPVFESLCASAAEESEPTLPGGRELGPYRIEGCIGRGGMGEVYRARDVRLARDVAIKIVPEQLASDASRLARLQREARLLASISHPRIGAIFDVYEEPGIVALVLELVEGPTLAERLQNGALPLGDAIATARQLVDALEAAHARGIVHRDLKPANVKIGADGMVKILDFGLARAIGDAAREATQSPAITLTGEHPVVLGTAHYMSPEQARGQAVDHRADIWAFGCVLYEMLAGRKTFTGETSSDVLAKVLERAPDLTCLPSSTPAAVVRLVERCLQKPAARRLGYIGDARLDLEEAASPPGASRQPTPARTTARMRAAVAVAVITAGAALAVLAMSRPVGPMPPELRVAVPLPDAHELVIGQLGSIEASESGGLIVYRARHEGVVRLFARALNDERVTPIPGTEDAEGHAVSPDGRWVAFGRDGRLFKVLVAGAPPLELCAASTGITASWGRDGFIVFGGGTAAPLFRVHESGGAPVQITTVDAAGGDRMHRSPDISPDGTVAFTVERADRAVIAVTDRAGKTTMLTEGRQPHFIAADRLLFAREDALWAATYDSRQQRLTSEPVPVVRGVVRSALNGHMQFTVAGDRSILYVPERTGEHAPSLVWRDRNGQETSTEIEGRSVVRFAMSPDESRIAVAMSEHGDRDVWIFDRQRTSYSRLTFDPAAESAPVWSPDGTRVAYRADGDGGGLVLRSADGSGEPRRLTHAGGLYHIPYSFTPDGAQLLFVEFRTYRDQNILAVATDASARVTSVLAGPAAETRPALSADGVWLAYQSDESGRDEVYVRPWPLVDGAKWQVSTAGGSGPVWRRDGRELFFATQKEVMATRIDTAPTFRAHTSARLFDLASTPDRLGALFDVSSDGRRFLVLRHHADATRTRPQMHLVMNWERQPLASQPGQ
jgi:eukaryotic-like serine/threonine-protein kinase